MGFDGVRDPCLSEWRVDCTGSISSSGQKSKQESLAFSVCVFIFVAVDVVVVMVVVVDVVAVVVALLPEIREKMGTCRETALELHRTLADAGHWEAMADPAGAGAT